MAQDDVFSQGERTIYKKSEAIGYLLLGESSDAVDFVKGNTKIVIDDRLRIINITFLAAFLVQDLSNYDGKQDD